MPLIPILLTLLAGWAVYALILGDEARLNPIGVASAFLLGSGINYGCYYVFIRWFQTNPPVIVLALWAAVGLILLVRRRGFRLVDWRGWGQEPVWTGVLLAILLAVMILTGLSGYGNDGLRAWVGRAWAYGAEPDYLLHLSRPYPVHPEYPPLFIHQIQWQIAFADSLFSVKLLAGIYFGIGALVVYSFLEQRVQSPVMWTVFAASLPTVLYTAMEIVADNVVSAFVAVAVYWIFNALSARHWRSLLVAACVAGLAVLVKREGVVLVGLLLLTLSLMAVRLPAYRNVLVAGVALIGAGALLAGISWYPLPSVSGLADFDPDHPRLVDYLASVLRLPGLLLYPAPKQFQPVWFLFGGVLLWQIVTRRIRWRDAPFWFLPAAYALGMLLTFVFSTWADIFDHLFAYTRLLLQVTPLVMIYLATVIAHPVNGANPE